MKLNNAQCICPACEVCMSGTLRDCLIGLNHVDSLCIVLIVNFGFNFGKIFQRLWSILLI